MTKVSERRISKEKEKKLLKEFRQNVSDYYSGFRENIDNFKYMNRFCNGDQWHQDDLTAFRSANKVAVVINKIDPIMKQILGELRQTSAQIFLRKKSLEEAKDDKNAQGQVLNILNPQQNINPNPNQSNVVSDVSQLLTAKPLNPTDPKLKVFEGLARNIAYDSDSDDCYFIAAENAAKGGFGAIRICNDYESERSMNQSIKMKPVYDPTKCFWDLTAEDPCKITGDYCGTIIVMSKQKFEREYPDVEYPGNFTVPDQSLPIFWGDKDHIAIGEIYKKEYFKDTYIVTPDGELRYASDFDDKEEAEKLMKKKGYIANDCDNFRYVCYKFTDSCILSATESPFRYLPIVFVDGNSYWVDGKQKIQSFAKSAVDSQKKYNYLSSDLINWLKLAKHVTMMAPDEVIPQELIRFYTQLDNPPAFLPYNGTEAAKLGGLRPESIMPMPIPPGLVEQLIQTENEIKVALGRYDAQLGAPSNETSGVAIANRISQGVTSFEIYKQNLTKAKEMIGRVMVSAFPRVYDEERKISITNRDGEREEVDVNKRSFNFKKMKWELNLDMRDNSDWDIEVKVGASYAIQKQQDIENAFTAIKLDQTGQAYSMLMPLAIEMMDTPKAKQMAQRLTFMTPPQILAAEQGKQFSAPPNPMVEMQQQQMQLQTMKLHSDIQKAQSEVQNEKLNAMTARLDAMSNYIKAQATMKQVENQAEIAPQRLSTELLHQEAQNNLKDKQIELEHIRHQDKMRFEHHKHNHEAIKDLRDNLMKQLSGE